MVAAMRLVIAEKPSVAKDIARVLGADQRRQGYFQGQGVQVTWALGHLVELAKPHEIKPEWKRWHADLLPMVPERFPLVVGETGASQFAVVARLLTASATREVVCATDAGREGELIYRYIAEKAGCDKPTRRLWISSLTDQGIRAGFQALRPLSDFDGLADAARGRSQADWLVGMNLSRAYTLALDETFSVGRVQTPTLAMIVERDREIRAFVPEDYLEVVLDLDSEADSEPRYFEARLWDPKQRRARRLPPDGAAAQRCITRARAGALRGPRRAGHRPPSTPPRR